jgi:hypothetical protein
MPTPVRLEVPIHPDNAAIVAATLLDAGAHARGFTLELTHHPNPILDPDTATTHTGTARLIAYLWTVGAGLDVARITLDIDDEPLADLLLGSALLGPPSGRTDPITGAMRALLLTAGPKPEHPTDDAPDTPLEATEVPADDLATIPEPDPMRPSLDLSEVPIEAEQVDDPVPASDQG